LFLLLKSVTGETLLVRYLNLLSHPVSTSAEELLASTTAKSADSVPRRLIPRGSSDEARHIRENETIATINSNPHASIDYRCEDGRFSLSEHGVTILNGLSVSSSESRLKVE
jgi:hypothetical protein